MKQVETWKVLVFVGILAMLAIAINVSHGYRQMHDSTMSADRIREWPETELSRATREKAEAIKAAAEHARYLARYLNAGFDRKTGCKGVAIAVESDGGGMSDTVASALCQKFETGNVQTVSSLFTREFITDGLLRNTMDGSRAVLKDLELSKSLDALCLARAKVDYAKNPSLENVISAHMHLQVVTVPVTTLTGNRSWSFTANGAGFTEEEARALAEERLAKQIAAATNMILIQ